MASRFARILTVLLALTLAGLASAGASASPGVSFSLQPSDQSVAVGQVFTLDVRVDASDQELDTVEAHVDYDPHYLQVVSEDGNPIAGVAEDAIVPGSIATTALTVGLMNRVDNDSGHVDIAYGIPPSEGIPVSQAFVLGTIKFRAVAATSGTPITFSTAGGRDTQAARSGTDVTGDLHEAMATITGAGTQQDGPSQTDDDAASLVTITSPADGTVTSSPVQVVTGTVNDSSIMVATLRFGRRLRVITVTDGRFSEEITLVSGVNTISVSVADAAGNISTARIEVTLGEEPAADAEPDTEAVAETAATEVWATGEEGDSEKPLTWPMMGGIIGGLLVIGLLIYFLVSRPRF